MAQIAVTAAPARAGQDVAAFAPGATTAASDAAIPQALSRARRAWQARYDEARARLLDGRFGEAADAFAALAAGAEDPLDRARADELAAVARAFVGRGALLAPPRPVAGAAPEQEDRRTIGELASLYTFAVLYGVGSGVTLAVLTEPASVAAGVLPTLGLAGLSAAAVYGLDTHFRLGYGVPQSITSGLLIGFEEGLVWTLWREASVDSGEQWRDKTIATLLWGTSTAGAVAGGVLGAKLGTSPGRAAMMHSAALWSAAFTGFTTAAISGDGHDDRDDRALLAAAIGLNAGAAAGLALGQAVSPSVARVRFLDLGGIAGGLVAGGLYLSFAGSGDASPRAAFASLAGGVAAGLGGAWYLTRGMEQDEPRRGHAEARVVPVLAPVSAPSGHGAGLLLGLAGTL